MDTWSFGRVVEFYINYKYNYAATLAGMFNGIKILLHLSSMPQFGHLVYKKRAARRILKPICKVSMKQGHQQDINILKFGI